tara:strand:- start:392 stop:556 length:165 start_codon:yes stop_codon:yes gene_type:complete
MRFLLINMSIIINEKETPLIVKLLKKAIKKNTLTEEELFIAHELYEDLKDLVDK